MDREDYSREGRGWLQEALYVMAQSGDVMTPREGREKALAEAARMASNAAEMLKMASAAKPPAAREPDTRDVRDYDGTWRPETHHDGSTVR